MELKTLYIRINCINRLFETRIDSDRISLHLNGDVCGSSDAFAEDGEGPVYIEWYGTKRDIQGVYASVSVIKRPSRIEAKGIPVSAPWVSNDDPRDVLRIDGMESESTLAYASLSVYLPTEMWDRLFEVDLIARKVYLRVTFMNSGENELPVENPDGFFFAFLGDVVVQILSPAPKSIGHHHE